MNLFRQRKIILNDGTKIKEGDNVFFINSDGERCEGSIKRRQYNATHQETGKKLKKGSLYFWNICFDINDYDVKVIKTN